MYISVSGMDSSELLTGRPFGGCAILYHKSLAHSIIRLKSCPKRFCAISLIINDPLNNNSYQTLINNYNVYLPTDYGTP